jgi:hypothetical protein
VYLPNPYRALQSCDSDCDSNWDEKLTSKLDYGYSSGVRAVRKGRLFAQERRECVGEIFYKLSYLLTML